MKVVLRHSLLMGVCAILLLALLVTVLVRDTAGEPDAWQPLATRLPMNVEGWQGEDVPLGETEAVLDAVAKLNYDDYVYRVYRKNGAEVFVYAMFWRQGRISVREMAGHTPDGCWKAGGAKQLGERQTECLRVDDWTTAEAQTRTFLFPNAAKINVAWWHLWGGRVVSQDFGAKSWQVMLKEVQTWLFHHEGRKENQLFVRVHSTAPLGKVFEAKPVELFLGGIPEVRLKAEPL